MGRGKVQLRRIEKNINRQVTFSKRKGGLVKKAQEISVLFDVKVALKIFSHNAKLFEFSSHSWMEEPDWVTIQKNKGKEVISPSSSSTTRRPSSYQASNYNSIYPSRPGVRPVYSSPRPSYTTPRPVIRLGGRTLIDSPISKGNIPSSPSTSVHLNDIPQDNPLYEQLQSYLNSQKQSDTFANIASQDIDDNKTYEKVVKQQMIFHLENNDITRKNDPWIILSRNLMSNLYFPGHSYKTRSFYETVLIETGSVEIQHFQGYNTPENVYNFSKIIIKHILSITDWGVHTMTEKSFAYNNGRANCTYWDYIQAFDTVLYYNNDRHKHTWFIKICSQVFDTPLPNWFLAWWSYHGPTIKILPEEFTSLYKTWAQVSPKLTQLYQEDHICSPDQLGPIYFFIEFSIPWIHKWAPEFGYTSDNIPCLYRSFYNNFWDKLLKKDLKTKKLYGQDLLDEITEKIKLYQSQAELDFTGTTSVKGIARRISLQESEQDKMELISKYMEKVKQDLLQSIGIFEVPSTPSEDNMDTHSNTSDKDDVDKFCQNMQKT